MRAISSIMFFICAFITRIKAQVNYVLNPSFEQYSSCPTALDQIAFANNWNGIDSLWHPGASPLGEAGCLPEYCNFCDHSPYGDVSVPNSRYFYQYPRTGNGMAQVRMLVNPTGPGGNVDIRDYLQGRLYQPLMAGKQYCVTFYVSLTKISGYAIDKVGAYLDDGSIDIGQDSAGCANPQTGFTPQVYASSIINDTLNWIKVQGSITATGAERFITIGNFFDFVHTDKIAVDYSGSSSDEITFYLIDDVSVIVSDAVANAGPDGLVSPGSDSAFIGTIDEGMPCTWYIVGDTVPIGYSGGLKVHPDTTTRYVVVMDLCGHVTRDTVVVHVAPAGVGNVQMWKYGNVQIYPNPATNNFTIEHAGGSEIVINDMVGQEVKIINCQSDKEAIDIGTFPSGVYLVQIIDPVTRTRIAKKIIKE